MNLGSLLSLLLVGLVHGLRIDELWNETEEASLQSTTHVCASLLSTRRMLSEVMLPVKIFSACFLSHA